jgi:hypothetical protein
MNDLPTPTPAPLRPVVVFSLSAGGGMSGPLARQATESLAEALSRFEALPARAHHLLGDDLDAWLGAAPEEAAAPRVRFILLETLPSQAVLREATEALGGRLALTGRLSLRRDALTLLLNLWDTQTAHLLWCASHEAPREALPRLLAECAAEAAFRLEAAPTLDEALRRARAAVGTQDLSALEAYATATERLRAWALQHDERPPHGDIAKALCRALELDPGFEPARLLLLEHALGRLQAEDRRWAEDFLQASRKLPTSPILYGLLRVEAAICAKDAEQAKLLARELRQRWPHDPLAKQAEARASGSL